MTRNDQSRSLAAEAALLLNDIYSRRAVQDGSGRPHPLHSETTPDEGALLSSLIRDNRISRSLEIGCAYGVSSLHICQALSANANPLHTIIDPFQTSEWLGIGVRHLQRVGCSFFELIEERSEYALPFLLQQGKKYQFALIDGYHIFDQVLVDFYFVSRLLDDGGLVVLDDVHLPSVRRVARFITTLPNYIIERGVREYRVRASRKRLAVEWTLRQLANAVPPSARDDLFGAALFVSDRDLGIGCEMVAFRKTGPDTRGTHWFSSF